MILRILICAFLFLFSIPAMAQDAPAPVSATTQEEPAPVATETAPQEIPAEKIPVEVAEKPFEYASLSMKNIARLYWRFNRFDPKDTEALNNYLIVTDCPLYSKFRIDDFKWNEILEAASVGVVSEAKSFPIRYEMLMPIKLADYDTTTGNFDVHPDYQMPESQMLFATATDTGQLACPASNLRVDRIPGYPNEIVLRANVPFELMKFPVDPAVARAYIDKVTQIYQKQAVRKQKISKMHDIRDAYVSIKFKIYMASKEDYKIPGGQGIRPIFNATIEHVGIYANLEKTEVLYEKNYRVPRQIDPLEQQYRDEYAAARAAAGQVQKPQEPPPQQAPPASELSAPSAATPVETAPTPVETPAPEPQAAPVPEATLDAQSPAEPVAETAPVEPGQAEEPAPPVEPVATEPPPAEQAAPAEEPAAETPATN